MVAPVDLVTRRTRSAVDVDTRRTRGNSRSATNAANHSEKHVLFKRGLYLSSMQLPHWGEAVGEVMGGASEEVEPGLWNSTVSLWGSHIGAASAAGMRQREQRVNCTLATTI